MNADPALYPADAAPRSYIYNSWNDFYISIYGVGNWRAVVATNWVAIPESQIKEPSDTIVFGEKDATSGHWYLDYEKYEDITQLDQCKHSGSRGKPGSGGSNYTFADGSVRFLRWGQSVSPLNMWATTPSWRRISLGP